MKRAQWAGLAALLGLAGAVAVLSGGHPPPPPESEATAAPEALRVAASPTRVSVQSAVPAREASFTGECAVRLRVEDPDGHPVAGQEVRLRLDPREDRPAGTKDDHGLVT